MTVQRHLIYVISTSGFVSRNYPFEEKKYLFTLTDTISKPQTASSLPKDKKDFKVSMYIMRVYNEP